MSQVEVDKIIPQSGTTLTIGDSGDTIAIASGATLSGSLNADNLDSGTVPTARVSGAYTGITQTGTLTSFASTGIDDNATSTAITIDSSENVGINETSPEAKLHIIGANGTTSLSSYDAQTNLILENNSDSQLSIIGNSSNSSQLFFGDESSELIGRIRYDHSSDAMRIYTNNSERMRIDSSGVLLIGKTSQGSDAVGVENRGDGLGIFTRDGNTPVIINRKTSDGTVIDIKKDGTTVGNINAYASYVIFANGNTGLRFDGTGDNIVPRTSTNTNRANTIDLGSGTNTFKDLYLGGGLYVGGTASANKLDDYEEGTFNPTLTPSTSGSITINNSQNTLKYTKIGTTVFIQGRLEITGSSSPTGVSITVGNMPFAPSSSSEGSGKFGGMCAISFDGSATFEPYTVWTTGSVVKITTTTASINSNTRIHFNFFYETA